MSKTHATKSQDVDLDQAQHSDRFLFRRLFAYSLPHKTRFLFAFALLALAVSAEMAIPWTVKTIIDTVVTSDTYSWQRLLSLSTLVIGLYLLSSMLTYRQAIAFRHGALLVVRDVRHQLFRHLLHFPIRTFDNNPAGKLVSYVTNDTESLREMYVSTVPTILQGALRIGAIFTAMALLDWRLMLMSLVLIPTLLLTMHLYRKISMTVFDGIRTQVSHITGSINETLQGISLIQAFNQEKHFQAKFEQENQRWFAFRTRSIAIDSLLLAPFTRLVSACATLGVVAWFATGSLESAVEIGTLYAFLSYIERFIDPFRQLSMELRKLQVATVASKRIFSLLDEAPALATADEHVAPTALKHHDIAFKNVSFSYHDTDTPSDAQTVLKSIDFTAKAGSFTAIVGHTGSGKSSIINLLMRFYQPQNGEILIGEQPLAQLPERQLRQLFGLVSQDPTIFSGTIADNIHLTASEPDTDTVISAAEQVSAAKFISRLPDGYEHQPVNGGATFSVGERQLIALARVVAHQPAIVLLDEATANIDSDTEEAVKAAIANIQGGSTVIAVAHRLSTVQHADQILVMNQGKIVQRGTHDQLVAQKGDYRELYLAQKAQHDDDVAQSELGLTDAIA
uniref:ABC transporter ATP-binding protein n=1 Tax=Thaumasiovibrio occultus TaxID=1891184 RepID=UPI000B35A343|nr:ABC transporter ATP-binding protein [Thaumasiovibrio occultus]